MDTNPDNIPEVEAPDFSALEAQLLAARQALSAREELKRAQSIARARPDSDEGREASEIARRLLAQLEWREVALVALGYEQVCSCGRNHYWIEGEYIERQHIRDRTARWHMLKSGSETVKLPKRVEWRTMRVSLCPSCLREHGYA